MVIDTDLITRALAHFYEIKEEKIAQEMTVGAGKKKSKRSNFESEKEVEERKRKNQKM